MSDPEDESAKLKKQIEILKKENKDLQSSNKDLSLVISDKERILQSLPINKIVDQFLEDLKAFLEVNSSEDIVDEPETLAALRDLFNTWSNLDVLIQETFYKE